MGEEPNEIEKHIDATRERIAYNLNDLEGRVKATTDWRSHFQKRPLAMIGAAFGAGMLLAFVSRRAMREPGMR